ncbi:MAG: hypothetical protein K1Y36_15620 [Blastocatellia bacterium]|nr:hypothetical protein [Blastocatellia bacterium]
MDEPLPLLVHNGGKAICLLFFALALFLALTVPIHAWDALAFGEWSRLIAQTGGFSFPSVTDLAYHRPLFYVVQGWIWRMFGFDETFARLWALSFALLLGFSLFQLTQTEKKESPTGWLTILLLLANPDFVREGFSGLTDVPVAALIACAAMVLVRVNHTLAKVLLLALVSLAAGLTKPSAFAALAGLAAAHCIGPRETFNRRLLEGPIPIAYGALTALSWHAACARESGVSLVSFLSSGLPGYYQALAQEVRWSVFLEGHWMGRGLQLWLWFTLLYAVMRVFGAPHGRAARFSAGGATALFWIGSFWGNSLNAGAGIGKQLVGFMCFCPIVFLVCQAGETWVPSRQYLARLLVWMLPPLVVWTVFVPYDSRLLSPAWTPLLLLMVTVLVPGLQGIQAAHKPLAAMSVAGLVLLPLVNLRNVDGVGLRGCAVVGSCVNQGNLTSEGVRTALMPDFAAVLGKIRTEFGPQVRLISNDGKFRFFFPGQVGQGTPGKCGQLAGYDVFVLCRDDERVQPLKQQFDIQADPAKWSACTKPRLTLLYSNATYTVFRIETQPKL